MVIQRQGLIFATDKEQRELAIFLIDEKDLGNDDEKMFVWSTRDITGEITWMEYVDMQLLVIS